VIFRSSVDVGMTGPGRREQGASRREPGAGSARSDAGREECARAGASIARAVKIYASRREQARARCASRLREQGIARSMESTRARARTLEAGGSRAGAGREQGDFPQSFLWLLRELKGDLGARKGFEDVFRRSVGSADLRGPARIAPSGIRSPLKKLMTPARALRGSARACSHNPPRATTRPRPRPASACQIPARAIT
jgi:hypothetical protein